MGEEEEQVPDNPIIKRFWGCHVNGVLDAWVRAETVGSAGALIRERLACMCVCLYACVGLCLWVGVLMKNECGVLGRVMCMCVRNVSVCGERKKWTQNRLRHK